MTFGCSMRAVAMMVSMQVSVITRSLSWGKPRRRARMATCCCDSSPVTYSAGMRSAMAQRVCKRMVDLPMPGSPPISTTEPSTRPPPRTRSSSVESVEKRGISSTLTSARVLICACWPVQPERPLGAAAVLLSITVSIEGVPGAAFAALAGPFGKRRAALGAAVHAFGLGHDTPDVKKGQSYPMRQTVGRSPTMHACFWRIK